MPILSFISIFLVWMSLVGGFTVTLVTKENNAHTFSVAENIDPSGKGNSFSNTAVSNFLQVATESKDKLYLQMGTTGNFSYATSTSEVSTQQMALGDTTNNQEVTTSGVSALFKKILAIDSTPVDPLSKPITPATTKYLIANVATHNSESDCWIIVNSNVYSVSSYIAMHPGGKSTIVNQCGKDASAVFTSRGGTGTHSQSAWTLLNTFLTGTLTTVLPPPPIDGSCGISQNITSSFAPSSGLCSSGKASSVVTGTSLYTWDCSGTNGGKVASCSAIAGKEVLPSSTYTLVTLSTHSTEADCYIAVNSSVYSVSSYIAMHPGGKSTIVNQCGKDASAVFTSRGGTGAHSTSAWSLLHTFLVGTLTDALPLTPANGSCGAATLMSSSFAPTASLCNLGAASSVVDGGTSYTWSCAGTNGGTASNCTATKSTTPPVAPTAKYTTATVGSHSSQSDCWIIVNSSVYSVGSYISMHPGGAGVITTQCGKDASAVFTSRGGTGAHSTSAWSLLDTFLIGTLSTTVPLTPTNGSCGAATLVSSSFAPTSNLCSSGSSSSVTDGGTSYTWSCSGSNGGAVASCSVTKNTTPVVAPTTTYTAAVIATHNTQANCWFIVNSNVYDVTSYISMHPGGASVINAQCGKEATTAFSTKSGIGSGSHTAGAWTLLNQFLVGKLAASTNPLAVNGVCGTSNGASRSTAPTAGLCTAGTSGTISGTGPWTWSCVGTNGGGTAGCSATSNTPVNGACGSATLISTSFAPTTGLCTTGTSGTVSGTGPWNWNCTGSNGGTVASCTASNNTTPVTPPTTTYTAAVIATHNTQANCWFIVNSNVYDVTSYISMHPGGASVINTQCGKEATTAFSTKSGIGSGSHTTTAWTLLNTFLIGTLAASTNPLAVNGTCGSLNGTSRSTTPTIGFCNTGTASTLSGTGPWTWSCVGTNGGGTAGCSANSNAPVAGVCGMSDGMTMSFAPTTGLCDVGTASAVNNDSVSYTWSCAGTNSGATASCTATVGTATALTASVIATHNTPSNCYIVIGTSVYSVGSYISLHPGGTTAISNLCGGDATTAYGNKGGLGTVHSAFANSTLATFLVGPLSGPAPGVATPPVTTPSTFTAAEIATHSVSSNCYIVIGTNVYSVGAYLAMHPGGAYAISKYCGLNATTAFGNKGGIGKTHTAAAQTMLGGFLIGTLSGTAPAATPVNLAPSSVYNTANIAAHNLSTDCWIIINSKVYSVAPYISLHPGGITKISNLCGKDATSGYNGEGHSSKAGLILGGLYIGTYSATAVATPTNGSCGTTNATAVATTPTTGLCTVGTVGTVSGTGPWTWSCAGTNGGTTASCSATKTGATATPVNGACGTSNGTAVASTPTTGLCTTGTSGTVSGTGPFTWSCTGTNGGTTASCTATLSSTPVTTVVNGSCGTSAGQTLSTTPSTGLCTLGTGSSVTSSNTNGTYSWNCAGTGGGTTASCTAKKVVSGSCGNADGQTVTSVPSSATDLCSRGTGSSVITGSTQYTWSCSGLNGGSSNSCSATISVPINGVCGSSSGVTATAKPTTNLCTAGRTGTVSGTGPWTWACTGRNGGTSASCTTLP